MHVDDRHASSFTNQRHVCKRNSFRFILWLVWVVFFQLSEHQQLQSISSTYLLLCVCVCVFTQVCMCVQYNTWRNGVNGSTGGTGRKGDRGVNYLNTITALTTSIHHLHPPSATTRCPDPGPAFPPGQPDALSSQRGPSPPCTEWKSEAAFRTTFPLPCVLLAPLFSCFFAPARFQPRPPRVGGDLALAPPLPPRLRRGE